jgi:hypothetical protein
MDLSQARIVLRPRTLAECMDLALRLMVAERGLFLRLSAVTLLPTYLLCLGLRHGLEWSVVATWTAAFGLLSVVQGVFTVAMGQIAFSRGTRARTVLREFLRTALRYVGVVFVARFATAAASLLAIVGMFWPWTSWLHVHEAVLLERADVGAALARATRLSRGSRSGLALLLAMGVALALAIVGFEMIGDNLTSFVLQLGRPFGSLWELGYTPFAMLGAFLLTPWIAAARYLSYLDVRTRQDGWDLQVALTSAASEAQAREAAAWRWQA